jgi:hypothetical protein
MRGLQFRPRHWRRGRRCGLFGARRFDWCGSGLPRRSYWRGDRRCRYRRRCYGRRSRSVRRVYLRNDRCGATRCANWLSCGHGLGGCWRLWRLFNRRDCSNRGSRWGFGFWNNLGGSAAPNSRSGLRLRRRCLGRRSSATTTTRSCGRRRSRGPGALFTLPPCADSRHLIIC